MIGKERNSVFDTSALICYLEKEPGWKKVAEILNDHRDATTDALLSIINWGEIYYSIGRRRGAAAVRPILTHLATLPIKLVAVDLAHVRIAAELKMRHHMSYGDALCAATAIRENGDIVTKDPEFKSIADLANIILI